MDIYELRIREHQARLAEQREPRVRADLSLLVVWAALAIAGAVLAVATRQVDGLGMLLGLGLFLAGAAAGLRLAGRMAGAPTTHGRPMDRAASRSREEQKSEPGTFDDRLPPIQFGPTPNK
jgi:hypothetical protein